MQWSKLKTRVKNLICPELKERIDFHVAGYRESHDGADKVWITIDGVKVFSCKHYQHEWAQAGAFSAGLSVEEVQSLLAKEEIHGPGDFGNAMRVYLDSPIHKSLESSNPLVKAFAIVDRRVGRRTFARLEISESAHSLVKRFYELRSALPHV